MSPSLHHRQQTETEAGKPNIHPREKFNSKYTTILKKCEEKERHFGGIWVEIDDLEIVFMHCKFFMLVFFEKIFLILKQTNFLLATYATE